MTGIEREELQLARRNANDLGELIMAIVRYVKALKRQTEEAKARRKKKKEAGSKEKKKELESVVEDKARLERELGDLAEGSMREGSVMGGEEVRVSNVNLNLVRVLPEVPEVGCVWEKAGYAGWKVKKVPLQPFQDPAKGSVSVPACMT